MLCKVSITFRRIFAEDFCFHRQNTRLDNFQSCFCLLFIFVISFWQCLNLFSTLFVPMTLLALMFSFILQKESTDTEWINSLLNCIFQASQPAFTCSKLTIETLEQGVEICSKLTIKTPGVFIVNFEHI